MTKINTTINCSNCGASVERMDAKSITENTNSEIMGMEGIPITSEKRFCEECYDNITKKDCKECECGGKAVAFHSGCCDAHFDGVVKDDKLFIACEKCGKIQGELKE